MCDSNRGLTCSHRGLGEEVTADDLSVSREGDCWRDVYLKADPDRKPVAMIIGGSEGFHCRMRNPYFRFYPTPTRRAMLIKVADIYNQRKARGEV